MGGLTAGRLVTGVALGAALWVVVVTAAGGGSIGYTGSFPSACAMSLTASAMSRQRVRSAPNPHPGPGPKSTAPSIRSPALSAELSMSLMWR